MKTGCRKLSQTFATLVVGTVVLCTNGGALSAENQAVPTGLILHDTFNEVAPFVREEGYHQFSYSPVVGPDVIVRYWHPGEVGNGAPAPSWVSFDQDGGKFGGGVSFNYSGSNF